MEDPRSVLKYWFGSNPSDAWIAKERAKLWWSKNKEIDSQICRRFEPLVIAAQSGALEDWKSTPEGWLALILVTDQFPRNIYRGSAAAFRFDSIALHLCLQGLANQEDSELRPIHRIFFYIPLEHSENLKHQNRCIRLFRQLASKAPNDFKPVLDGFIQFALRHQVIIERFGRFPHRNKILGRPSTTEELEFLKQPGSSF